MAKERRKRKTHVPQAEESQNGIPTSMVIKMGNSRRKPTKALTSLVRDFRQIMQPHTAARLKERRDNKLKDYFVMAGPLGVSNFFIFSQSVSGNTTMRIGRTPRGPTLYFRINKYSLSRDIQRSQARPHALTPQSPELLNPPVLVLNNFSAKKESNVEALLTSTFQNILPTIHVDAATSLSGVRRVLLLNRVPETGEIELRHYVVVTRVVGTTRAIKKLNAASRGQRAVPDLRSMQNVAQFLSEPSASDSEAEDEVIQPPSTEGISEPTVSAAFKVKKAVRLIEVGPRINMSLLKVEEGLCAGKTLFHSIEQKSSKEAQQLDEKHRQKDAERAKRRKQQEENVRLKREAQAAKGSRRKRGEERMKSRSQPHAIAEGSKSDGSDSDQEAEDVENMNDYELDAELANDGSSAEDDMND